MLLKLLRTHLAPYRRKLIAVTVLQLVQTIANLMLPSINANIIDRGIVLRDTGYIWSHGGLMLGVTFVQAVFAIVAVYYGSRAAMGFGRDVRNALFAQVTDFSAREVATFGAPSLITRITNDSQQVQMLVQMICTLFIGAPIMAVGGTIMALREDVGLSVILVFAVPVLAIAVGLIVARMVPAFRLMQERLDTVNRILREQITGLRVVRAFVREPHETDRFEHANDELTDTALRTGRLMARIFPVVLLVLNGSSVAAIWLGTIRIIDRDMQIGALIAFLSYLAQILMSVMMATFMAVMIPRAAVSAERIQEVLDTSSSVVPPASPASPPAAQTTVLELRNATFRYPGAETAVVDRVSFEVRAGETTAIIGSTGAGKTTLLNLIPRLMDVTDGSVLVDGVDVRQLDAEDLWRRIGFVPQKPFLFSGTVASNLRHADPDATDEQLWAALEVAQGKDFVAAMEGGLDAPITQGGTNVSGGQRQRLCIARALVRQPRLYLFDDSFSALDLATDARLRAALVPWTRDSAVVIVAQRVSTILHADRIVVLEDGAAVGIGTHHELLESCPTYAEIVESQMRNEEAA